MGVRRRELARAPVRIMAISPQLLKRFTAAVRKVERRLGPAGSRRLTDANVERDYRKWLDDGDDPLPWSGEHITADEFFFITTLYGNMTIDQQRAMIRKFFPSLFVHRAQGDTRNFRAKLGGYDGLRSGWMKARLCKMGALLRKRGISMQQYVQELHELDKRRRPKTPPRRSIKSLATIGHWGSRHLAYSSGIACGAGVFQSTCGLENSSVTTVCPKTKECSFG